MAAEAFGDAAKRGDLAVVEAMLNEDSSLIDARRANQRTALMMAAMEGRQQVVQVLLNRGASVNLVDEHGRTALSWAALRGHAHVVSLLLENGADPGIKKRWGETALMSASSTGRVAVVERLLRHNPTHIHERDDSGCTALLWACSCDYAKVVKLLLLAGADHTIASNNGTTPRQVAERDNRHAVIEVLDWFASELERSYCLAKARRVEDDREAIRLAGSKAEVRTEEEAQRAREEAAPEHVRGRVMRDEALPMVEVVGGGGAVASSSSSRGSSRGSRRKRGRPGVGEVRRGVLQEVVGGMKEDCFIILRELMGLKEGR